MFGIYMMNRSDKWLGSEPFGVAENLNSGQATQPLVPLRVSFKSAPDIDNRTNSIAKHIVSLASRLRLKGIRRSGCDVKY